MIKKTLAHHPDKGQNYSSPFDNIYPWSKMGRVLVNKDTGDIVQWLGKTNSKVDLNGSPADLNSGKYDVMVYVPVHARKITYNPATETFERLIKTEVPSVIEDYEGYTVPDAFIREDGTIAPYFLYGAFLGSIIGSQLRSVPNVKSDSNKPISSYRTAARQGRDNNWNIGTIEYVGVLQNLYLIEFQDMNAQKVIGRGVCDKSWNSTDDSLNTGGTLELGNRTGYLGTDNGQTQISYRGIEDFYGDKWQFLDGLMAKNDGYYVTNKFSTFGTISGYKRIACTPLQGEPSTGLNGYVKKMESLKGLEHLFIAKEIGAGATADNYYTDYFWAHENGEENIALFGGAWADGSYCGAFCLYLHLVASHSDLSIGARVTFRP